MSKTVQMRPGFRPNGDGPDGERYGRDPVTNRSYLRDGSLRKERVTKTAQQVFASLEDARRKACANVGRGIIKAAGSLSAFVAAAGTFRKWLRDAVAYSTPEKVAERKAYHQRMLAVADAKAAAAGKWLPAAEKARTVLDNLSANVGTAFLAFAEKHGRQPTPEETEEMLAGLIPADVREMVVSGADPEADPFGPFRRDAADADTADADTTDADDDLSAE